MQYQPDYAFILPLDDVDDKTEEVIYPDEAETPLTGIEIEVPKVQKKNKKNQTQEPIQPIEVSFRQNFLKLVWYVIRWHVLSFLIIFGVFYSSFHFVLHDDQKEIIMKAVAFCDDWKQLIFFYGLYVTFAVKKVSDVSSNIPISDKIANLLSICSKSHKTQKAVIKYVCTAIAMVFSCLSPMVRKRLFSSENKIKAQLETQSRRIIENVEKKLLSVASNHFMPIKWSLNVIIEARDKKDVDDRLANILITEINALHTQCDRLVALKHETFSRGLTWCAIVSVYSFFTVGAVRQLWTGLVENHAVYILTISMIVNFLVFICFLLVLRSAEQIIVPYNDEHDVFELNRILNEKLEVASFILDKQWDLRKRMGNRDLLP
ncbi:Bestrophin-1 [Pseudolycoriella hygida]|uniref:Bestrophin homolog n=1 Tax=Pseudolycoriella hygida TaxID=35572 RepID=A0A9Q0S0E3_9DIPT|nr:Bestrophin-1 [Pseudolycoriella hygida]